MELVGIGVLSKIGVLLTNVGKNEKEIVLFFFESLAFSILNGQVMTVNREQFLS